VVGAPARGIRRDTIRDRDEVAVRFKLRPSEDAFYDFFNQAAHNLVRGAELLTGLTVGASADQIQSISEGLQDVEHANDDVTHALYNKVNSTFITPFDREDIYRLGSGLDDVMDAMESAGNLVYLYGLSEIPSLPREMSEQIETLNQLARLTAEAMPKLKGMKGLEPYWIEVNRLENEGDRQYRMLLVRLFSGEYEPLNVLKMKEVADDLEEAIDAFEHVANTVETIAAKES
jgi:predicted phosphate transport protein (TIGR00153 family)